MADIRAQSRPAGFATEWRVLGKAGARDTDAECLELVDSRHTQPRRVTIATCEIVPAYVRRIG